ncbi:MAG: hypothetical protein ABI277_03270 [Burkholderiaceae bacterium]
MIDVDVVEHTRAERENERIRFGRNRTAVGQDEAGLPRIFATPDVEALFRDIGTRQFGPRKGLPKVGIELLQPAPKSSMRRVCATRPRSVTSVATSLILYSAK